MTTQTLPDISRNYHILCYFPELDGKILLLKISYMEDEKIKLVLTKKHHPFCYIFLGLKGTMHATGGEK